MIAQLFYNPDIVLLLGLTVEEEAKLKEISAEFSPAIERTFRNYYVAKESADENIKQKLKGQYLIVLQRYEAKRNEIFSNAQKRELEYFSHNPEELFSKLKAYVAKDVPAYVKGEKKVDKFLEEAYHDQNDETGKYIVVAGLLYHAMTLYERKSELHKQLEGIIAKTFKTARNKLNFSNVLQGTATNKLTKINSRKDKQAQKDPMLRIMKITREDFTVMLLNYSKNTGLRQSAHQLLDALIKVYTNSGGHSSLVTLPLREYMEMRGLKDIRSTRQQAKEDLDTLANIKLTFMTKRRGKIQESYFDLGIIQMSKGIVNGVITAYLDSAFCSLLGGYKPMPYPNLLWRLSENRNPNSFYFLRKTSELKYMNSGKTNEDIIAVLTLLNSTPNILSYEEIMESGKHLTQQIIEPFERDMDALDEVLAWEYCHSKDEPLTDEELVRMDYEIFKKLYVKIYWRDYPDQTERLEHKALAEKKHKNPVRKQNKRENK